MKKGMSMKGFLECLRTQLNGRRLRIAIQKNKSGWHEIASIHLSFKRFAELCPCQVQCDIRESDIYTTEPIKSSKAIEICKELHCVCSCLKIKEINKKD